MPVVARTTKQDKVRELQRTLYRAAKADPGRRFHALYDKVYRRDVLERAWELVRANRGAAGIDRQTIADVEQYGREPAARRAGRGPEGRALASASGAPGVHPEARQTRGAASALDPGGPRPRSCRRPRRSSSSRSSRPTCSSARSGFGPGARRTMRSRSSSMRPGGAGGGLSSRTSPTVSRRSRTPG